MSFHPKNYDNIFDFCKVARVEAFRYGQQSDEPLVIISGNQCLELFRQHTERNGIEPDEFKDISEVSGFMYDYEMESALIAWLQEIYAENPDLLGKKFARDFDDLFLRTVHP